MKIVNPEPKPGLRSGNFRKICENGFGDRNNTYAHTMAWFQEHLYVGTTRASLCLVRRGMPHIKMDVWPVECPNPIYSPEFERTEARAEIWRYYPPNDHWERVFQAPMIIGSEAEPMSRELGYRSMVVFQGKSDGKPALYTSTWSRSRGSGSLMMRSSDGKNFAIVSKPGLIGLPITSVRSLLPFKGRLFMAPASVAGSANISGVPVIYESRDPAKGEWRPVNEPGFGDPNNLTIYELQDFGDYLYASTANNNGFQIWRTKAEGNPPYDWTNIITNGAGRGSLNQGAVSMIVFKDALYVGTGIQNGGYDRLNQIGPAGAEIIRIHDDGTPYQVVVGDNRNGKRPLSGMSAGFNSICNGYMWKMCVHDDWLYVGTFDWSVSASFTIIENKPEKIARLLEKVGIENIVRNQGGSELWRSYDGENWLPVTRQGFGNPYNYGFRNLVSTPYGLFIGTANPYGPKVAKKIDDQWTYVDNPDGGLEVWLGK